MGTEIYSDVFISNLTHFIVDNKHNLCNITDYQHDYKEYAILSTEINYLNCHLLSPSYFNRFKVSIKSVRNVVNRVSPETIWLHVCTYLTDHMAISTSLTFVKSAYSNIRTFVFISRKAQHERVIDYITSKVSSENSEDSECKTNYIPSLPVVKVDKGVFENVKGLLRNIEDMLSFDFNSNDYFTYEGCKYVAFMLNDSNGGILMRRIIPLDQYLRFINDKKLKCRDNVINRDIKVSIHNVSYIVLLETFLLTTISDTSDANNLD